MILEFTIKLNPRTKKNSQQIIQNRYTGKPQIIQSKLYKDYEKEAGWFMPKLEKPIDYPVNIQAVYYRDSKRIVDLNGLNQCLHDVLVKYGVLKDDNCRIVVSTDGSRVLFDKKNPRTEVTITRLDDES